MTWRCVILATALISFLPEGSFGQAEKKYVLRDHSVIINGHTNVNRFSCKMEIDQVNDTLQVQLTQTQDQIDFEGFVIKLPIDKFKCGNPMMNSDLRNLLQYKEYPFLELQMKRIEIAESGKGGDSGTYTINALITIADVSRTEVFENSEIEQQDKNHRFVGHHQLYLTNYNLEPPQKFFGTVKVDDKLDLEFEINIVDCTK